MDAKLNGQADSNDGINFSDPFSLIGMSDDEFESRQKNRDFYGVEDNPLTIKPEHLKGLPQGAAPSTILSLLVLVD